MNDATFLRSLITVPYLPLLGPVHPDCINQALVEDIFRVGATDDLLPYDKDRRWYATKPAQILFEAIRRSPTGMIVPVITVTKEQVRLLCYGEVLSTELEQSVAIIKQTYPSYRITIISFAATSNLVSGETALIILLKNLSSSDVQPDDSTVEHVDAGNASDLVSLAVDPENSGFKFLAHEYGARKLGPTFVVRDQDRVVAAVGPIDTMLDNTGRRFCLPPYFGVASKFRERGLGTLVWRAGMASAANAGSTYLLLQAEAGQVAAGFYARQGLVQLGAVITRRVV